MRTYAMKQQNQIGNSMKEFKAGGGQVLLTFESSDDTIPDVQHQSR